MSIFTNFHKVEQNIVADFDSWWESHVKPVVLDDVEPVLKKFFSQFTTQFGAQAITAALGGVAALETGTPFAVVTTSLAATLLSDAKTDAGTDAALDATQVLQTIQSALQVAKIANDIVTPPTRRPSRQSHPLARLHRPLHPPRNATGPRGRDSGRADGPGAGRLRARFALRDVLRKRGGMLATFMTLYSILSVICRLLGFIRAADSLWHAHELKVKAREIADAPTTKAELEETLRKGDL